MTPSDSASAWQSIVICDGVTIGAVKAATCLRFSSGLARRISKLLLPTHREILTRVALYLALAPAGSASERGRDAALEIVLERLDPRR
jgi:hypothetical protein